MTAQIILSLKQMFHDKPETKIKAKTSCNLSSENSKTFLKNFKQKVLHRNINLCFANDKQVLIEKVTTFMNISLLHKSFPLLTLSFNKNRISK
jgi:hypothetical protein